MKWNEPTSCWCSSKGDTPLLRFNFYWKQLFILFGFLGNRWNHIFLTKKRWNETLFTLHFFFLNWGLDYFSASASWRIIWTSVQTPTVTKEIYNTWYITYAYFIIIFLFIFLFIYFNYFFMQKWEIHRL